MQDMLGAMPKMDLNAVFKENPMFPTKNKVVVPEEKKPEPEPVP
jgi:hypothetical protein